MTLTFLFLQIVNAGLAAASLWIRYRNPSLWDDQALILSVISGVLTASFTALLLGISVVFSGNTRWRSLIPNLILTLAFAGVQIWLLWTLGRDMGLIHYIRSKLG